MTEIEKRLTELGFVKEKTGGKVDGYLVAPECFVFCTKNNDGPKWQIYKKITVFQPLEPTDKDYVYGMRGMVLYGIKVNIVVHNISSWFWYIVPDDLKIIEDTINYIKNKKIEE